MSARPLMLALGKFDSLHLGHRALVDRAAELGRPGIVRFRGLADALGWSPRPFLLDDRGFHRVLGLWADHLRSPISVITIAFEQIRSLDPQAFLRLLRDQYRVGGVVAGEDFRFGRDRAGDVAALRDLAPRLGMQVSIVKPVLHGGQVLSTTILRDALAAGRMADVTSMLDRPYRLVGTVVSGAGRGRQLGFPTANCACGMQFLPACGVYAAWVRLGGRGVWQAAAVNIGRLPTFADDGAVVVEAHLIDWQGDCYGQAVEVEVVKRVRGEERFANVKALTAQITADVAGIRQLLGQRPPETKRSQTRRITA